MTAGRANSALPRIAAGIAVLVGGWRLGVCVHEWLSFGHPRWSSLGVLGCIAVAVGIVAVSVGVLVLLSPRFLSASRFGNALLLTMIALTVALVTLVASRLYIVSADEYRGLSACIGNLMALEGAIEQSRPDTAPGERSGGTWTPSRDVLQPYLKAWPMCPRGGSYGFDPEPGLPVRCTVHGSSAGIPGPSLSPPYCDFGPGDFRWEFLRGLMRRRMVLGAWWLW